MADLLWLHLCDQQRKALKVALKSHWEITDDNVE